MKPEDIVMKNPNRGRVYRRCACRGADGRPLPEARHLLRHVALDAVKAIETALKEAEAA